MAAGLGYKEFTTGDVLTAADANGYLASQVVMVFADSAARTSAIASPQEGMISYLKDTNSTQYYSGSAWVAIGGGGGKVLQVVSATYSTATTIASTTFTDTGLSATITPSAASSKVLVLVQQASYMDRSAGSQGLGLQLVRAATNIVTTDGELFTIGATGATVVILGGYQTLNYLDSPSTTSATTYKMQMKAATTANSGKAIAQVNSNPSSIVLLEIGA